MKIKAMARCSAVLLLLAGGLAGAQPAKTESRAVSYPATSSAEVSDTDNTEEVGERTENWLQLQRSGAAASATPQQATAAERELSYQRLLDSYRHPIPEYFEQDVGGSVSSDR